MNTGTRTALVVGGTALALLIGVPLIWGAATGWRGWGWGMTGPGMMWGFGWMWFMPVFMIAFWGLVIWAVVALVQGLSRPGTSGGHEESALEVLKRRYAGGEITKEEYEEKKRVIA